MSCGAAGQNYWPLDVEDLGLLNPNTWATPTNQQEQLAFGYCNDSRWLACPDQAQCPLYAPEPLASWRLLPCQREFYDHYGNVLNSAVIDDDNALEQFLSNEKRKEKSRDAARSRRSRETDIFTELAQALPCPQACPCPTIEAQHLDKASVMRLAIAYLKTRTLVQAAVPKTLAKPEITPDPEEHLLKALDGFVLVLDNNGDMVYLTPNVKDFLGIAQMDLMGQSIYDYSHPCDHDEIRESFAVKSVDAEQERLCNFFLRLKCTLTSKGRKVNLKSASYKVLHCTGRIIAHTNEQNNLPTDSNNQEETQKKEPSVSLVVVASPVPHPSNIEIPLGKYTFLSKHNLNMKFTYADDKLADFLGWESKELMGQSVFDFHHALDNASLDKSFKSLFSKGQCETMAYRFLNKRGGYAWVVTQATLIHCSRLQKPLSVVCVNYLLSGVEHEDEVYSVRQLEARASSNIRPALREQPSSALQDKPVAVTASLFRSTAVPPQQPRVVVQVEEDKENDQPPLLLVNKKATNPELSSNNFDFLNSDLFAGLAAQGERPPGGPAAPESATASIFAPRTKEMNKGFLTFSEDQPGLTMLKDEPDDLTHLAPTAGDVCVPLEEPPFLSDMLDEFILGNGSDSYCSSSTPNDDGSVATSDLVLDPFICRRGPELESETEPELDSPKSSDTQLLQQDDGKQLSEDEMLMMSISDVMADDELALRAPYIPMSDQDEALQLLISDDVLMWPSQPGLLLTASPDEKKWSSEPPDDCIAASKPTNSNNSNSSLAQLLSNDYEHLKDRRGTPLDNSMRVDNNSTSSNHHNNKRPNAGTSHKSSHESLSKRLKHSDTQRPVSQLLQQLQQQSEHRPLGLHQDDGGGRMDTSTTNPAATTKTGQPPHSSSVLMNLLVSGCDMQAIQEELQRSGSSSPMAGLTLQQQPQQQNKISELQMRMEEQLQRVPQWTNNLNSDSVSSMSNSCSPISKQQLQTNFEPLSYDDELSFINSADMLRDNDELFSVLDSTLL